MERGRASSLAMFDRSADVCEAKSLRIKRVIQHSRRECLWRTSASNNGIGFAHALPQGD